jgi:hypothetical protein
MLWPVWMYECHVMYLGIPLATYHKMLYTYHECKDMSWKDVALVLNFILPLENLFLIYPHTLFLIYDTAILHTRTTELFGV